MRETVEPAGDEIRRVQTRKVTFPVDRAATDTVPHRDLRGSRACGGHGVVLASLAIVRIEAATAPSQRHFEIAPFGCEISRPVPVTLLQAEDRCTPRCQPPADCCAGRAGADYEYIDRLTTHDETSRKSGAMMRTRATRFSSNRSSWAVRLDERRNVYPSNFQICGCV